MVALAVKFQYTCGSTHSINAIQLIKWISRLGLEKLSWLIHQWWQMCIENNINWYKPHFMVLRYIWIYWIESTESTEFYVASCFYYACTQDSRNLFIVTIQCCMFMWYMCKAYATAPLSPSGVLIPVKILFLFFLAHYNKIVHIWIIFNFTNSNYTCNH